MARTRHIAICLIATLSSTACSTRPRTFSASVRPTSAPVVMVQDEAQAYATCDALVRKGHKGGFASAAATGAAGVGVAAVTTGTVVLNGAVSTGWWAPSTAASAAVPVVGLAMAMGVNRIIRSGREKSYRKHMSACFAELGYEVVDWTRMKKKQKGTATLVASKPVGTAVVEQTPEVALTTR